jgi:hypothetical protein
MPPTHCPPIPMIVGDTFFSGEPAGTPRSLDWIKSKNPSAPAVRREAAAANVRTRPKPT